MDADRTSPDRLRMSVASIPSPPPDRSRLTMRAAIFCLGVLTSGSLLSGAASAQFVPAPFLGDFGETGFVPTNTFPFPANGYGFQGDAGVGLPNGMMGNPGLTSQERRALSNIRQQFPSNPYGLPQGLQRIPFAPTPPMQQTPYPRQFPYAQQLQNMQLPRYAPQPQYIGQPTIAPHLEFGQQPQYMMTFPLLQPSQ
jgi:hypothetical protein